MNGKYVVEVSALLLLVIISLSAPSCTGGLVGAPCDDGYSACINGCFDFMEDSGNCGDCGVVCASGETCQDGVCRYCPPGTEECGGECVDLTSSIEHCGQCFGECELYQICESGQCSGCPSGTELCGGECVDTSTNDVHCGQCDNQCDEGSSCQDGACVTYCDPPLVQCGDECVSTQSNTHHCGECDNECDIDELCVAGKCEIDCGGGLVECGGECVDLLTDNENCGGCDIECGDTEICEAGSCIADCGILDWCDTACVDLASDNDHCGSCNSPCSTGWFCVAGTCSLDCPSPFVACGSVCVDLETSPFNCGWCGNACATGICIDGACKAQSAGHLVAIGHDLTVDHVILRRLVGNAVFMAHNNPVEVLAYVEYADTSPGGQMDAVDSALNLEAAATGQSWNKTVAADAQNVVDDILMYDVLLVYRQGIATDIELDATGVQWFSPLRNFLSVGGIIVFTDGPGSNLGTWQIFNSADLFDCAAITDVTGSTADVVEPGDAVAQGLSTSYLSATNSVFFSTSESLVVTEDSATGNPLVIHKVFIP